MKTKWLFLIVLLFSIGDANAIQKPILISGFDDVLRQAENTSLLRASIKIFEEDQTFTGMQELYQSIVLTMPLSRLYLVSAISHWFDGRIGSFLEKEHFPPNRRYLRHWFTEWSIEKFKIEKIQEILKENSQGKAIVIFDNSEASIQLVQKLKSHFPDRIATIYLRQVVAKEVPIDATAFYTAFDIAAKEYAEGRLAKESVLKVGQVILNEKSKEKMFPSYALCPKDKNICEGIAADILETCQEVEKHIHSLCR